MLSISSDNDIYRSGTKIGWIEGDDIYDEGGLKIGYFSSNDIYRADGEKLGWIEGGSLHQTSGSPISLSELKKRVTGNASDMERAAAYLLF